MYGLRVTAQANHQHAYAKTKVQISCAVTAQLISVLSFATRIVRFLFSFYPNVQASSFSVTMQAGLYQTWLEPLIVVFCEKAHIENKCLSVRRIW